MEAVDRRFPRPPSASTVEAVRYRVLGSMVAAADGREARLGGPRQRLVLALLLRDAARVVADDRLIDALWPDEVPSGARHTLQTYISELRRTLDDEIVRHAHGYELAIDPGTVDAHRFEALAAAARERMTDSPAAAAALLRDALGLWRGEPYADLGDVPQLRSEVHRLNQLRLEAVEDRFDAELRAGLHSQVVVDLEALARDHPYRERFHELLMIALYRNERQAEALRAYDRARETLVSELGLDPSSRLQDLHRRILAQDPELDVTVGSGLQGGVPQMVRGFELRSRIDDHGPMAMWHAYQPSTSHEVILTVVSAHEANTPAFIRRFAPHAKRLTRTTHPHLLPVTDHWREPRGAYLVSPRLGRRTVHATLADSPWSPSAALRLLEQVARALDALHRAELVHGRLSASTILLDDEGNALVNPAWVLLPTGAAPTGTAPEVRRGEAPHIAADVYGLGRLALEVMSALPPPAERPIGVLHRAGVGLPEDVTAVLARATADDPAERHDTVERFLRRLRRTLGVDVVGLQGDEAAPHRVRNPYKGLRPFDETDAQDFFGRERLVEELVAAVEERSLVAVVGPSGSGKSSLVRAGLVPMLRDLDRGTTQRWFTDLFPGAHPFEELEAALLRVAPKEPEDLLGELLADERGLARTVKEVLPEGVQLVLIIDQFEEVYSLTADARVRRQFLDALVSLAEDEPTRVRIVITLRADFFDRPLQHHDFGRMVQQGLMTVGIPSRQDLARSVSQPAQNVGVALEPGLVDRIVEEVADQAGALPLLQYALTEMFEGRDGDVLTADEYGARGGIVGALGHGAEELYRSLAPAARTAAQQVFLRLLTVDASGELTRRRVRRAELASLEADRSAVDTVVQLFGARRLLSFDRDPVTRSPTVEVSHEALFDAWPSLRDWVDARREDLLLHQRLGAAVSEWQHAGEATDYLLAGGRLEHFEAWAASTTLALTEPERSYLTASRQEQDARSVRQHRRRRRVVATVGSAAVLATILAIVAFGQAQRARSGERAALSRELAAASRLHQHTDPDLSVHLALEAVEIAPGANRTSRDAVAALHEALLGHRLLATADAGGTLVALAGSEDRVFVSGPPNNDAAIWDLTNGTRVATLRADGRAAFQVAGSADGSRAVETFVAAPTLVWDLDAMELLAEIPPTTPLQLWPALSADGTLLAVANLEEFGGSGQTISIWDLRTGRERLRFAHEGNARDLAFSPDASVLAVADMQNAVVRMYDTGTGEVVRTLGDPADARGVNSVAFHPSGDQLAMFVFTPRELRIVDLDSTETVHSTPMGTAALGAALCYSADGETLAVAAADELLNIHDAAGNLHMTLPGSGAIGSLVCGSDGGHVIVATDEGVIRQWGLNADDVREVLSIASPAPFTGVWTPSGDAFVTTHYGSALIPDPERPVTGTLHRYDAGSGELLAHVEGLHPFPPWWIQLSPDERYVVSLGNPFGDTDPAQAPPGVPRYARLVVHDAATLERIGIVEPGGWPLMFGPETSELLIGEPGRARIVDVSNGRTLMELPLTDDQDESRAEVVAGGYLDDGRHVILLGGTEQGGSIVNLSTRRIVSHFCVEGEARIAISPDGSAIAIATVADTIQLWETRTLLAVDGAGCGNAAGPARTWDANGLMGLSFDGSGSRLAAAGRDGVLVVMDVATGTDLLRIRHDAEIGGASFSPDGRHVLATINDARGSQHALRIYTLDTEELAMIARERITRALTDEECQRFNARVTCGVGDHHG